MQWKKRQSRIIKKFALFPIADVDGNCRWLEWVYISQYRYRLNHVEYGDWHNIKFITKEEYLKYKKGEIHNG